MLKAFIGFEFKILLLKFYSTEVFGVARTQSFMPRDAYLTALNHHKEQETVQRVH